MNHDHLDPINSLHVPELADMTFAMDFLIRAKEGVRNTAVALTETASPDVRAFFAQTAHARNRDAPGDYRLDGQQKVVSPA